MMFVCHPEFSFNDAMGLEVLNPSVEFLVPMALGIVTLKEAGDDGLCEAVDVAQNADLLILLHPCLNLLFHLVDGAKRNVKLGELVVTAVVIGSPEVVPCVVMLHLDARQTSVMTGEVATIEEVGAGVGGDEILHQNVEIDGNQIQIVKTLVKVFRRIEMQNKVLIHKKVLFYLHCKSTQDLDNPPPFYSKVKAFFINRVINRVKTIKHSPVGATDVKQVVERSATPA